MKFPFGPSMSDYKNINLPFMLLWSKILSVNRSSLSKASISASDLIDYSEKNILGYCRWKK